MAAQAGNENATVEFRLCGADGVTRWMRERSKSQELPGGAIEVIGIATDISSSRAAAAALAASEAKLEHVLKAVDAYVYVLDADEHGVWHTISASPNRERFTGGVVADGDASRSEWLALIHPDDKEDVRPPGRGVRERHAVRGLLPPRRLRRRRALGARSQRALRHRRRPQRAPRPGARRQRPPPARAAPAVERRPAARRQRRAAPAAHAGRAAGAHRCRHRRPQPARAQRARRARARGRARRRPRALRPRPLQADQRRARPRRRRPRAGRGRAPPARRRAARTTASRAGAARSSPCSSATSATSASSRAAPSSCSARSTARRSSSTAST